MTTLPYGSRSSAAELLEGLAERHPVPLSAIVQTMRRCSLDPSGLAPSGESGKLLFAIAETDAADGPITSAERLEEGLFMMRRSTNFLLVVALLGLGIAPFVGCSDPTTRSITIVSPATGTVLRPEDDVAPSISGVQIDITVRMSGFSSGDIVSLSVNDVAGPTRTYSGDDVVFNDVSLEGGENTLLASAGSTRAEVTVTLEGMPTCSTLSFVRPTASARIETRDDADGLADNGFQYDVQVATDADDGTDVELLVGGTSVGTATATGDRADFAAVTFLGAYPAAGSAANVTLRVQTSPTCTATITVQVVRSVTCPSFTFVDPTDGVTLGAADDENGDLSDGFQKTVVVSTSGEAGTEVELLVNGGSVGTTTVSGTVVRFESVDLPEGTDVLRVQTDPDCGTEISVTVDTGAPTCDIAAPLGGFLNAADDSDTTAAGFQSDFDVISDAGDAQPVTLIIDGVETGAPTVNISGGHARFGDVDLSEGSHTVRARCRNAIGNVGFSATFTYDVDSVIPSCSITAPAGGTWFNPGDDALTAVDGVQIEATVHTTDAPTATTVSRCGYEPLDPAGIVTLDGSGNGSGYVTLTGIANEVCCAVEDEAGNAAEGRVTLNLETDVPQFEIRRPDATTTLILAVNDEGPSDTACQYTVTVGCSNVGLPVTLYVNTVPKTPATCTSSADPLGGTASWASTALPQGSVTLRAEGSGVGGLVGTSPDKPVTVDTEPPVLTAFVPACGTMFNPSDDLDSDVSNGIQLRVLIRSTDAPVTLNVTNASGTAIAGSPYVVSTLSGGYADFDSVSVVPAGSTFGTAFLSASAVDAHGQVGASVPSPCSIEVRDAPRVTITSPSDRALLGPSSDCNTANSGFDLGVSVSSDSTSGTAELFLGGTSAGTQPYSGAPVTFCVPAADAVDRLVRAEVRDVRGTGYAEVRVTIDSTPPAEAVDDVVSTIFDRRRGVLDLAWTAPADTGGGPVAGYQTRCLSSASSTAVFDWATATAFGFSGVVGAPGSAQTQRLSGFRIERYVTCMVRATDGVGSLGPLGNAPQVQLAFLQTVIPGPAGTSRFGREIEPLGDVNGDTHPDFAVGTESGASVYVFFGQASGVPSTWSTVISGSAGSNFGWGIAGIGDFNGDTIGDLAIGAWGDDALKGRAYVFLGRSSWPASLALSDAAMVIRVDDPSSTRDDGARLGADISPAGDYDGDTLADFIVGVQGWDSFRGAALIYFGRSTLPATVTVPGDEATGFAGDMWLVGPGPSERFGYSVDSGYRINADTFDDVVIGAHASSLTTGGAVYISRGRARTGSGLTTLSTFDQQILSPVAASSVKFGARVTTAHLNGDTFPDLLVYMDYPPGGTANDQGAVLFFLNSGGTFGAYSGMLRNDLGAANDWLGFYLGRGQFLGSASLSDVDGDGRFDLLAGMYLYGGAGGGRGALFFGRDFATTINESSADLLVSPVSADNVSQAGVGYIQDVNGDGNPDFAVGHTRDSADQGRIVLVY